MSSSHILYCRICIISSFQVFKDVQANSSRFVLVKRDSAAARGVKTRAGSLCRNPPAARLFIFRLVTKPLWGRHKLKQRERLHYIHIIGLSVFPRHTGGGGACLISCSLFPSRLRDGSVYVMGYITCNKRWAAAFRRAPAVWTDSSAAEAFRTC